MTQWEPSARRILGGWTQTASFLLSGHLACQAKNAKRRKTAVPWIDWLPFWSNTSAQSIAQVHSEFFVSSKVTFGLGRTTPGRQPKLSYTELLTSAWESPNQLNQVWGFSSENPSSMLRKLHSFQLPSGFKSANVTWGFPAVPAASVRPVALSSTTWSPSQEHCTSVRAKQASGAALADQSQTEHQDFREFRRGSVLS